MAEIRIGKDDDGELDEVVAALAHVHLERMSDTEWTLIIASRGRKVIINLATKRAPISGVIFEDGPDKPYR